MKHVFLFSLFIAMASLLFTNGLCAQSCLPQGVTFTTQQQIDDFAANYPNCTEVGNINISEQGGTITSLSGLSQITSIYGGLFIVSNSQLTSLSGLENLTAVANNFLIYENPQLTSLNGLENLTAIDGYLKIYTNAAVTSLSGLDNLTAVNGFLEIWNNAALTSLNGLENLTTVDGFLEIRNNYALTSLSGLENLTTINGYLEIDYNAALTSLSGLDNLTAVDEYLFINNSAALTSLSGLENLTTINGFLEINNNDALTSLSGLDNLTTVDEYLFINSNAALTSLSGLENLTTISDYLFIDNNTVLTSLSGLGNLTTIGGNLSIQNNVALTSLISLDNLTTIGGNLKIDNNAALSSLVGLDSLTSIDGFLRISDNDALISLDGLENIDYSTITYLDMEDNPALSVCGVESICNYLVTGGSFSISNNAAGCNIYSEILNTCENLTTVKIIVYHDVNQNEVQDSLDPYYTNSTILIEPTNEALFPNSQTTFLLDPGNYTAFYDLSDTNWELTTDSASYFLSLGVNEADTIYFGVSPTQQFSEQISYISAPPARCNEVITFDVSTKNLGTTITSGTLWFVADLNATSMDFEIMPDLNPSPNLYGWNFSDLYPSQTFEVQVDIGIPGPPDFPLGDLLNFDAYAQYMDVNGWHPPILFEYHTLVECSYDPNDKLVFPSRNIDFLENYTLFDESLFYTVRFQNTGNAEAYDVVILDTLDANLDWSTFQFLSSSHADVLTTTMDEEGILTFDFKNIFLPDSTSNFEGSQGYVSYLIKANTGLAENTIIENSAGIYFDSNPPVITNTTENVMVSELPTISVLNPEDLPEITIIPNPNTGIFEISGIAEGDYTILNTAGQIIQAGQVNNGLSIDISAVPQGVYFISIAVDEQVVVKRVVKL